MFMYDTIIIGAGPAGITAGIYAKRGNLETLIIHNCESALQKATKIENYYGFIDGITGDKLYYNGIRQAEKLGIDVKNEEVLKIEFCADSFKVITNVKTHLTKSIILATGTKKNAPKIKGIKEFEGKGISYCAICDGFFYKNKTVAVVGNGSYAVSEANDLINIVSKLIILTNGAERPQIRGDNVKRLGHFERLLASGAELAPYWDMFDNELAKEATDGYYNPVTQEVFDELLYQKTAFAEAEYGGHHILMYSPHPEMGNVGYAKRKDTINFLLLYNGLFYLSSL